MVLVPLAREWADAGRKLRRVFPRGVRAGFDALVLDLLRPAQPPPPVPPLPPPDPAWEGELVRARLRIGVTTASALANECADPELLAAAVALPWYDGTSARTALIADRRPLDWAAAMVLAMIPVEARTPGARSHGVRQLAALPPLLRGAVLHARAAGGAIHAERRRSRPPLPLLLPRPLDDAEIALLAYGVPEGLLPLRRPESAPSWEAAPEPVGSPAEAIALVRARPARFGAYTMWVAGRPDTGYVVTATELVYQVRWDAPPEAIAPTGPPVPEPGGVAGPPPREPGWVVDRVTRDVYPTDLAGLPLAAHLTHRRAYPLPPGWCPAGRPPVPDGLAATAPPAVRAAAEPVLRAATVRYAALLATEAWPDFLVAWRVGLETVRTLGVDDPRSVCAALLAAQGTGEDDTLVDDASPLWDTPAGAWARIARPAPDETDGPGAARRAGRLADAPAPVRALVVANAHARSTVEAELFGVVPAARRAEQAALQMGG